MTALGFLFSSGLVLAYKKLRVEEDPKIEKVSEALPQANCGACGFSGCRAFAEAVVKGEAETNGCPVGGSEVAQDLAEILGVKAKEVIQKEIGLINDNIQEFIKKFGKGNLNILWNYQHRKRLKMHPTLINCGG